ncbi:kinetochore-associated protein KNL-2 homolog isoform X2 [Humulus lupulus]|uniref:kinetochore-associated protein KNL-2 homolog isoform X2 n=1 Tax=Humulus lupulus TaxID=3486 RepID=UPI002B40866E|nr:kinetochore-associated protein KNL-2 homolog isoform X2 [Humulus lupulus]
MIHQIKAHSTHFSRPRCTDKPPHRLFHAPRCRHLLRRDWSVLSYGARAPSSLLGFNDSPLLPASNSPFSQYSTLIRFPWRKVGDCFELAYECFCYSMADSGGSTEVQAGAGSSSHFGRTVCLFDWWLIQTQNDLHGNMLGVAGLTSRQQEAVRVFTSAPIAKRYDVFTLETADDVCIILKGLINKHRTTLNGFSSQFSKSFMFGFPSNWQQFSTNAPPAISADCGAVSGPEISTPKSVRFLQEKFPEKQGCVTRKHRKQVETSESHKVSENGTLNSSKVSNLSEENKDQLDVAPTQFLQEKSPEKLGCVTRKHRKQVKTSESHKDSKNSTLNSSKVSNLSDENKDQQHVTPIQFLQEKTPEKHGCVTRKHRIQVETSESHNISENGTLNTSKVSNLSDENKDQLDVTPIGFRKCSGRLRNLKDRPIGFQKCSDKLRNPKDSQTILLVSGCSIDLEQQNVSPATSDSGRKLGVSGKSLIHSTDRVPKISFAKVGSKRKQQPVDTNVTVKLGDESLSTGPEQTSNSKRRRDSGNVKTKAGQETGFKGGKHTKTRKREIYFDTEATPPAGENKSKVSLVSPDCLSYGRSRSGRLLLPVMEFWRNQMPVYDVDRKLTGIQESTPVVVPSRGTQSEPRKKLNR